MDDYKKVLDINFLGVVRTCRTFLPLVRKSKGRVINLVSYTDRTGFPQLSHYCASKFAAQAFSESLRFELEPFNVKVVTIEPWFYKTPLVNEKPIRDHLMKSFDQLDIDIKKDYGQKMLENHIKIMELTLGKFNMNENISEVIDALVEALVR